MPISEQKKQVNDLINSFPLDKSSADNEIKSLIKVKDFVYSIVVRLDEKIEKVKSQSVLCEKCKRYYKKHKPVISKFTKTETWYTDAGYGDDDTVADVTYIGEWEYCPYCKHATLLHKTFVSKEKERNGR